MTWPGYFLEMWMSVLYPLFLPKWAIENRLVERSRVLRNGQDQTVMPALAYAGSMRQNFGALLTRLIAATTFSFSTSSALS